MSDTPPNDGYKRPFDIAVLIAAHVLLLPLWVVLWTAVPLAIWLGDRGHVLYGQTRLGKDGRPFKMLKFRTMVVGAEAGEGAVWADRQDERQTGVGRILRRYRIDEAPQVINMLRGEMSIVGPRPERPELHAEFERSTPGFGRRLRVKPGLAGLAQVRGRYSTPPRDKLRYDCIYVERMGPLLDLKLLAASVWVTMRGYPH